jgi:NAD(P)-dependent dehydrogenase (short-subunit alcohol dehydrogenase family)
MLNSDTEKLCFSVVFAVLILEYTIVFAVDVSDNYEDIEKALHDVEEEFGAILMLVNCAGMAICGRLEDTSVSDIKVMSGLISFRDTDTVR